MLSKSIGRYGLAGTLAGRITAVAVEFLRELSGESDYHRYVESRHRCWFPEESIMTRTEYERWRSEVREERSEHRC